MPFTPTSFFFIQKSVFPAIIFSCLFLACHLTHAQRPQYRITATLDTAIHIVSGTIDINYTNLEGVKIDSIAIHLWPNAYREKNTALVQQMLHLGNLSLYRAREESRGGLHDVEFVSRQQNVTMRTDPDHIDMAWISFRKPLSPGEAIQLTSSYQLKIPESFSRLGRTGESYQLTQWYPHIAVYDEMGWHAMSYLDAGEYFNDFADYTVTINTPGDYKVAATGTLISTNVKGSLTERVYHADDVIDFAWFASPDFRHEQKTIDVGEKEYVTLNVYIDTIHDMYWDSAMMFAERAMKFYSEWLGPYPYDQMTVVSTPFSKAGYMEYPMVAQISAVGDHGYLDRVITHEIGHTWLYAILASDERNHPWIDEGFNSFLEDQYMQRYYTEPDDHFLPSILENKNSMDHYDAALHWSRFRTTLQPPESPPDWQTNEQYLFSAYMLPAKGLKLMKVQLGEEMMKRMFSQYFNDHQFTHVSAADIRSSFEKSCNCDLSWFFNEWVHHSHEIDYRIKSFDRKNREVTMENHAEAKIPLTIAGLNKGSILFNQWVNGFEGTKTISLQNEVDEIRLYHDNSVNKHWLADARPRKLLPHLNLIPQIADHYRPSISITPVFGYNLTDGFMPGGIIMSDIIPQPRAKFLLMPFYGVDSKKFRYHAETRFTGDIDLGPFDKWMLSASGSNFAYQLDTHYLFRDHYQRLSPGIALRLKSSHDHSHVTRWLKYRYVDITQYYGRGINFDSVIFARERRHYGIHELSFKMESDTVMQPYSAQASIQGGDGFVRLNLHYNQHFAGRDKGRGLWLHAFAGWLPYYKQPKPNVLFSFNGLASGGFSSRDYMYDEWLIGRNASEGNFTRQVFMKDAGLKTLSTIGISEKWMLGAGASVSLPVKVVHLYMDAALYPSGITEKVELSYSGGLAVILIKDAFEIYIPFLESKDIRESLTYQVRDQWYDRISFQANFKIINPFSIIDRLQLKY